MPSLKIPKIVDTAVTTVKELLAFATLPYYQVSGVLKSAEGEVVIGDPVSWETATKKFVKYDPTGTAVTAEAVGTGDGTVRFFALIHGRVVPGSYTVYVNAVEVDEWSDYTIDLRTGYLNFLTAPPNTEAVTADYSYFGGLDKEVAVGFVRIPGDSTDEDVPIEVHIGGAVKWDLVAAASNWNDNILVDLGAIVKALPNALIF